MLKYEIYIPTYDNLGAPFTKHDFFTFEEILEETFGGFTHNPTPMRGVWYDQTDGKRYEDIVTTYIIFADDEEDIRECAQSAGILFDQFSVSVIFPDGKAEIINTNRDNMLADYQRIKGLTA